MIINLFGPMTAGKTTMTAKLWVALAQAKYDFVVLDETVWNVLWDVVQHNHDGNLKNGLPANHFNKSTFYSRTGRVLRDTGFLPAWIQEFKEFNMIVNCWIPYIESAVNIHLDTTNSVRIQDLRSKFFDAAVHLRTVRKTMLDHQAINHRIFVLRHFDKMDDLVNEIVRNVTGDD